MQRKLALMIVFKSFRFVKVIDNLAHSQALIYVYLVMWDKLSKSFFLPTSCYM